MLHTAPEAAAGGPLALVRNGDMIELDVAKRRIHLHVSDDELARRKTKWKPLPPHATRGWVKLYCDTVLQADRGVDLDFLVGKFRGEGRQSQPLAVDERRSRTHGDSRDGSAAGGYFCLV